MTYLCLVSTMPIHFEYENYIFNILQVVTNRKIKKNKKKASDLKRVSVEHISKIAYIRHFSLINYDSLIPRVFINYYSL